MGDEGDLTSAAEGVRLGERGGTLLFRGPRMSGEGRCRLGGGGRAGGEGKSRLRLYEGIFFSTVNWGYRESKNKIDEGWR